MARAVESGPSVRGRAAAELGSCCAEVLKCPTVAMNVAGHLEWVSECWGGHAQDADCCLGGEESLVDALLRPDPAAAPLGLMYDKGVGRVKEAASGKGATLVCKLPPPPPPPPGQIHTNSTHPSPAVVVTFLLLIQSSTSPASSTQGHTSKLVGSYLLGNCLNPHAWPGPESLWSTWCRG